MNITVVTRAVSPVSLASSFLCFHLRDAPAWSTPRLWNCSRVEAEVSSLRRTVCKSACFPLGRFQLQLSRKDPLIDKKRSDLAWKVEPHLASACSIQGLGTAGLAISQWPKPVTGKPWAGTQQTDSGCLRVAVAGKSSADRSSTSWSISS